MERTAGLGHLSANDWERLQEFQTWDPRADDLEAYAITCIGHPAFTAVIKTHFELFQGSRLMLCEGLTDTESLALRRVFSTVKWNSF